MEKLQLSGYSFILQTVFTVLAVISMSYTKQAFSQDTMYYTFTGATEQLVIPPCVNGDIEVFMAGASGGDGGYWGNNGGMGAELIGSITVSGGDVLDITVGGEGPCPGAGFNGGGMGFASANGNNQMNSCGGGGSSNINVNGVPTMIAAGGGGSGGGGTWANYTPTGGPGGCNTGTQGSYDAAWNYGYSPFAQGGMPGTQTGPGAGGNPWAGVPPGGSPGFGGQGGNGGQWNTASGGGGGGGYFGGGGGGNDGCCTGANAGGGGGGGSSLWPIATVGCTPDVNDGNGYITIIIPTCDESNICSGDSARVNLDIIFPPNSTNFTVINPATDWYQPIPGDSIVYFFHVDTTIFQVQADVGGSQLVLDYTVNAVDPIFPDAGLDDSLCFAGGAGVYNLNGTLDNSGIMYWDFDSTSTFSGGAGMATFGGPTDVPNVDVSVDMGGEYFFVIYEEDTNDICPIASDTVMIYFSEENHTTAFTDPICFGYSDGTIDVTTDATWASGNLGATNYAVNSTGTGPIAQTSPNFTGLPSGVYTVYSYDYLGCVDSSNVTLTDPPAITITLISSDSVICQNGTASFAAQGNNAPAGSSYTYYWTATTGNNPSWSIAPSPPGTDMTTDVYCQTTEGCYSDTATLNITHHPPISFNMLAADTVCPGDTALVGIMPNVVGGYLNGNLDYTYSWTEEGALMPVAGDSTLVTPTEITEYCVTVADGCETTPVTECERVYMRRVPDPMFTSDSTWGCNPSDITFMNTTDPQDVGNWTWKINGQYYYNEDPLTVTFDQVGSYHVWLEVESPYGCVNDIFVTDYITIYPDPDPEFSINPNPTTIYDTQVEFHNLTPGDYNTYEWIMPGGSPNYSTDEYPEVIYPEGVETDYPVTLIVTNEYGCIDTTIQYLSVLSDVLLYAPNIFTPDGDEFNETWRVYMDGIDIYNFHLTMFNRWGEIVWESFNKEASWNGHYGGGGLVPDGTYIWKIECREQVNDRKHEFHGHVTVLK